MHSTLICAHVISCVLYRSIMYENKIFVFGSRIFPVTEQDALSSLPLELSWKILSYLDDMSLRTACRVHKIWNKIILSCKRLRNRLNKFELAITLGSENLAKFYRKSRKRLRKEKKNYVPVQENTVQSSTTTITRKRKGGDLIIYAKRYKLY